MVYRSEICRTGLKRGMLFTALAFGVAQATLAATPTTTVRPLILSGRQSTRPAGTYSAGIADVIKMLDAKVDAPVILAYIQNSPIPYNPEATELIALKEHGASTETLVALLHHGDELSLQLAQAQSAVNPPPAAPATNYAPAAVYPVYPYDYPDSSAAPYPATDYGYAYGWPLTYWYAHGRYYPRSGYRNWASTARPTPYAPQSVAAPSRGHTSSGGSRGSGHSGGRSR
jgi:hypothetical protein